MLALLVRLPGLTESLWYDELWSTSVMLGSVGDLLRVSLYDIHPPAYSVITFGWTKVFGDSEVAVRAIPLLSGLATVGLMPTLGRAIAAPKAGWLAGVLLALSPVHIWYSQEARPYSTIMLLTVLLVLAWRRLDREPSSRATRFWFIAGCVAIAQFHYYGIAIPGVLAVIALWQRRHRAVVLTGLTLSLFFLGALLMVKRATGALKLEAQYLGTFSPRAWVELFGSWFPLGGSVSLTPDETPLAMTAGWLLVLAATTLMVAWIVAGWRVRRDTWLAHTLLLLAAPGVLVALWLLGSRGYYIERSALSSLPFYFLAVASAIWLITNTTARRATIAVTVLASVVVLAHFHGRRDRRTVYKPNPDWRGIVDPMLGQRQPQEPLVVFSTTPLTELVYYLPGAGECSWPADQVVGKPATGGVRGRLARTFPVTRRLTCGSAGTASVRLYVSDDSTLKWIDEVRAYERDAKPLLILNARWAGRTHGVIRAFQSIGQPLRSVARSQGLEVYALGPNQ